MFAEAYIPYHGLQDLPTPVFPPKSTPWLCIATDKEGLIKRILSGLATTKAFAGAALCSEYDVVNEIIEIERRDFLSDSNGNMSGAIRTTRRSGTSSHGWKV